MGDAIAHTDRRDRGLATRRVRELCAIQRVVFPTLFHVETSEPFEVGAEAVRQALRAQLKIIPESSIIAATGLTLSVAESAVGKVVKRIKGMKGDAILVDGRFTEREQKLVEYLLSVLVATPAYSDTTLLEEFSYVLARHGCLTEIEREPLQALKPTLAAFTVVHMHGAVVKVDDEAEMEIFASILDQDRDVTIWGTFPHPQDHTIKINLPIFQTSYQPRDLFSPAVLAVGVRPDRSWELNADFLIAEL